MLVNSSQVTRGSGKASPGGTSRTHWLQERIANHHEKPQLNFNVSLPSKWGGNSNWKFSKWEGASLCFM